MHWERLVREIRCQFLTLFGFGDLGEALGAVSERNKVSISHVIWLRGGLTLARLNALLASARPQGHPQSPKIGSRVGL